MITLEQKAELVDMDDIDIKASPQIRVCDSESTIKDYWDAIVDGDKFPPIDLFWIEEKTVFIVADGHQRYWAHDRNNEKQIVAYVHEGGEREALLFALGANKQHGLRRTDADKRRAVEIVLKDVEWMAWTDRRIAEKLSVSNHFVAKVRKELTPDVTEVSISQAVRGSESNGAASVGNVPNTPKAKPKANQSPTKRTGTDGKTYNAAKPPTAKTGGAEKVPVEKCKEVKELWGRFYRSVKSIPEFEAAIKDECISIADKMAKHWKRGAGK